MPGFKVLNVAEKNDAAKNIANIMSGGRANRREGFSQFNKIYEFDYMVQGQQAEMVMTSLSGHLLNMEFAPQYRKWYSRGQREFSIPGILGESQLNFFSLDHEK